MAQSETTTMDPGSLEYFHERMKTVEVRAEVGQKDTVDLHIANRTTAEIPREETGVKHTREDVEFTNQPTADLDADDSDAMRLKASLEGGILIMKRS